MPRGNLCGLDPSAADAEARAHAHMALEPPDWDAARAAFAEAAEQGSPRAMSYLGWMYEEGHGVARDGEQAADWYGRAVRAGAHDFAVKLGWMYLGGDGVAQDREQAEFWFRHALAAGHVPAQVAWASVLIADAQGGRDAERVFEAQELLEQALEDGHDLAAYFLARIYIEGIGAQPVDDDLAAYYTRLGADDGHAQMQGWLAFMHANGQGVERDLVAAAHWANLAAANGDTLGGQLRLMLDEQLDPEQVREARQRAVDWALQQR
ncbi:MAG: sel1 repeat family protein [Thioalkalivibrio sp.]|nr:sel1 repeat family protein [Thioalkalivibrio sp.]